MCVCVCVGPKDNTLDDFWEMAWEEGAHVIVQLGLPIESNVIKFYPYWPDTEEGARITTRFVIDVSAREEREHYAKSVYKITERATGKFRDILHYQWTSFPDHGVPGILFF